MGLRDKFKNVLGSNENDGGNSESQEGTGNLKHIAKLILNSDYVVLDRDIVLSGFEKRLYKYGLPLPDNVVIDGAGHTIDAQGLTRIFIIVKRNITLKNITFKNGFFDEGGAISITESGSLKIINCTFEGNSSKGHGGAIINFGKIDLEDVVFINNNSKLEGGAINNQIDGEVSLSNCSFRQNNSQGGGGGAVMNLGQISITESTFENNSSNNHAGAIYNARNGNLEISKTIFLRNAASVDGGAINNSSNALNFQVDDCKFIDNRSDVGGGAIVNWANATISNSEFQGNFSKAQGYDINCQGSIRLLNSKFGYIKGKSLYSANDDSVEIESCEFLEYDD